MHSFHSNMLQYFYYVDIEKLKEELHEKQKKQEEMQDELKGLKESLKACIQSIVEVSSDRDRLRSFCIEIDEALEVTINLNLE